MSRRLAPIFIVVAMLLLFSPVVRAEQTEESYGVFTEKDIYILGETVRVYALANYIAPDSTITIHNVTVYDAKNQTVAQWLNVNIVLTDTETTVKVGEFTATAEGQQAVYAEATGCPIRILRWFFFIIRCHVIPEMPLGTIVPLLASFTAIGSIKLAKSKKPRRSSLKPQ